MGLFSLIRGMDTKRMRATARQVAREAHRPTPVIFCDMVWCGFKYQAGYLDYALFHFWDLTAAQRATVLTRGKNNRYVSALNGKEEWNVFDEKPLFLKRFAPFVGRRWLDLTTASAEELRSLGEELGRFLVKPRDGTHGDGVEIISAAEVADWAALLERLRAQESTLCEEVIVQHPDLNAVWPGSVNTVRVVTILKEGKAYVVAAYLRVGNSDRPVDNFNGGGMAVPVDKDTGVILASARDKAGTLYECHPATGTPFQGTQLPLWPEVLELVGKAALVVPSIRYVGWDVAFTPKGPVLVEGNQYPGHDIYCLPGQNPSKIGLLPVLDAVIPYKSL